MKIAIPKESQSGETRVACTPATVPLLQKLGFEVAVERGAGEAAGFTDAAYEAAGASIAAAAEIWKSPLVYKVNPPNDKELAKLKAGQTLVSFLYPRQNEELVQKLTDKKVNALAMDMVPRISRAQALDALSSMANISGYRAVIEAANAFGRFFNGQITAAGKVPPAQVLVIGAGVAGLAAIGTANSLGAVVKAFDTRLEVAEQIESMGGKFLKLDFPQEAGGSGDGYAKVMSDEFIAGGKHESRLGDCGLGGGNGRQLRADEARRAFRYRKRRKNHRLHRHGKPSGWTVVPALCHQSGEPDQTPEPEQRRRNRAGF